MFYRHWIFLQIYVRRITVKNFGDHYSSNILTSTPHTYLPSLMLNNVESGSGFTKQETLGRYVTLQSKITVGSDVQYFSHLLFVLSFFVQANFHSRFSLCPVETRVSEREREKRVHDKERYRKRKIQSRFFDSTMSMKIIIKNHYLPLFRGPLLSSSKLKLYYLIFC